MIEFYTVSIKNVMFRDIKYFVLIFADYYVLITLESLLYDRCLFLHHSALTKVGGRAWAGLHLFNNLKKGMEKNWWIFGPCTFTFYIKWLIATPAPYNVSIITS